MKVKIIEATNNPFITMCKAAKTCYSKLSPIDIVPKDAVNFVKKVLSSGHLSIAEHIYFTFAVEGITRSCSHQLVRHRLMTFSQQSQRYVDMSEVRFIEPESILNNREADAIFNNLLIEIQTCYKKLLDLDIKKEDARSILPNCTTTNLVFTVNLRELMHIANMRLCNRSQSEIKGLFHLIKEEIKNNYSKEIAELLKPQCDVLGYCPEANTCGRKKVK